jgi:hypothetical protein
LVTLRSESCRCLCAVFVRRFNGGGWIYERLDLVMRIPVTTYVGCLAGLSRVPGNPGVVNVHADTADM